MNKVLRKIATKVLLMPRVKAQFKKIQAFYDKQAQLGHTDWLDIKGEFPEKDAKALEKVAPIPKN